MALNGSLHCVDGFNQRITLKICLSFVVSVGSFLSCNSQHTLGHCTVHFWRPATYGPRAMRFTSMRRIIILELDRYVTLVDRAVSQATFHRHNIMEIKVRRWLYIEFPVNIRSVSFKVVRPQFYHWQTRGKAARCAAAE